MDNVIKFEDLEIPALTEVAKESFEEALWATEKALAKQLEFGRVMLIVKSKLPYGEWGNWVRETFLDQMSLRNIQFHMKAHQEVAKNPSLLECANSLDEILTLTEKPRKPAVEVAAECGVTREQIIRDGEYAEALDIVSQVDPDIQAKVRSGKVTQDDVIAAAKAKSSPVKATEAKAPASPQQVSPPPERKPPSVQHIGQRLMRLGKDKKKHDQLMQIAELSLHYVTVQERIDWLSSQLIRMSANDRLAVFRDVSRRIAAVITE